MEKEKLNEISKRVMETLNSKMNKLFKQVLTNIEKEAKAYKVDPRFFAKGKDKTEGFRLIRKHLLDEGNDIIKFIEIILGEVEVVGKKSVVNIKENNGPKTKE